MSEEKKVTEKCIFCEKEFEKSYTVLRFVYSLILKESITVCIGDDDYRQHLIYKKIERLLCPACSEIYEQEKKKNSGAAL